MPKAHPYRTGDRGTDYIPRADPAGVPTVAQLAPYIPPRVWAMGLTAVTLQRVIVLRRQGVSFTTICLGGLGLPKAIVEHTYNKLPAVLR